MSRRVVIKEISLQIVWKIAYRNSHDTLGGRLKITRTAEISQASNSHFFLFLTLLRWNWFWSFYLTVGKKLRWLPKKSEHLEGSTSYAWEKLHKQELFSQKSRLVPFAIKWCMHVKRDELAIFVVCQVLEKRGEVNGKTRNSPLASKAQCKIVRTCCGNSFKPTTDAVLSSVGFE